nr:protein root UVB sensitive 4 [Ipomoea batatas]
MQSTLHIHARYPWIPQKTHIPTHKVSFLSNSTTSLKPFTAANSLKTPVNFGCCFGEEEDFNLDYPFAPSRLPVIIRQPSGISQYFWDGNELKLVSLDGKSLTLSDFCLNFEQGFQRLVRVYGSAVRNFFLPKEVSENYLEYVKWKFVHRVFSSALQVLATQAMFRAIGVGYSRSLPSAAALNWVLKDGLGRLCRCIYTATLASAFDTNLKRVRFSTSVLFSLSIGIELLTPVCPQYFLVLASIANIAKQICLACYLATGTAVHKSFAMSDNLGEVSAKAQIQLVCFDNLGLMLAAVLNFLCRNNPRLQAGLPFLVYPIFSALDLYGIYQGLKHVHLQTLTKDRLEIIVNLWIEQGRVPSPAEVSKEEGIELFWAKGKKPFPVRIGCLNAKNQLPKLSMMTIQNLKSWDFYFLCLERFANKGGCMEQYGILLSLREGAGTAEIIMALLHAFYVRKGLLCCWGRWESNLDVLNRSDAFLEEWLDLIENGKESAEANLKLLIEQMSSSGWNSKNILLSTQEQARYSFLAD